MPDEFARSRPTVPNWTYVTAPAAKQALDAIVAAWKHESRAGSLGRQAAAVLGSILRLYAAKARPPTLEEVAGATAMTTDLARECLDVLRRLDLVIVDSSDLTIQGAYPFTERTTPHTVTFGRRGSTLGAMCAVDALGAGSMCRKNAVIASSCGLCGLSISANVGGSGMALKVISPASSVVWVGLGLSGECAADTLCKQFLFFCCGDHLGRWQASGNRSVDRGIGYRLSPEEAFQVGKALFADRAMLQELE
jgi:Alkylmercury lyase